MEQLDLSSLNKAVESLGKVIAEYNKDQNNDIVRDSLIQRFEYTYGLSLKMMQRYLNMNALIVDEQETFSNIVRQADKIGLLKSELENWVEYRAMRNISSHTYDENKACVVAQIAVNFFQEAEYLLNELRNRNKT